MSTRKIEAKVCDICEITPETVQEHLAKSQCALCNKDCCRNGKCDNIDTYYTTTHSKFDIPFICTPCWQLAQKGGYLPRLADARNSGSSWACAVGDFTLGLMKSHSEQMVTETLAALNTLVQEAKKLEVKEARRKKLLEKARLLEAEARS